MHNLAVEVRQLDRVAVDEAERVDAEGSEVEGGRGAEATEADDEDAGVRNGGLAADGDRGKEGLAVVAGGCEGGRGDEDGR